MMNATLLVTPQELKNTASTFMAKANQVKGLHDGMLNTVKTLNTTFTGEVADAYTAKFNGLQASMETIYNMIQEHVHDLNEIADAYINAENIGSSVAESLGTMNF